MSPDERLLFQHEMTQRRKSATAAVLITLFLGGIGGQRYYMGQVGLGVLSTLFCWTLIPLLVSILELFTISTSVRDYNLYQAQLVAARVHPTPEPSEREYTQTESTSRRVKGLLILAGIVVGGIVLSRLFFGP